MKFEEWYNSYKITGLDKRTAEQVWDACKYECIKLVQQSIQNCDLSVENVDNRVIDRLEKEI
jgi:hypothetical protein